MTWEMIRITGLVALAFLTMSVALGIAGPAVRNATSRLVSVSMHLTAAVAGISLVLAHIVFAILDTWVSVPLAAAVVPGASQWETLWVGVGTVAFDLLLVLAVTSAMRQQAPGLWRKAHIVAYPMWGLVWIHTLAVGTDAGTPLMIVMAAASAGLVTAAIVVRRMNRRTAPVRPTAHPTVPLEALR
jgi:methionine sulfoxide reductase heme-binding subunit